MTNPWLERRILVYGHQGGAKEAPSSTLHAFARARGVGCRALEMDVHCTRDGVLVVCHDATVDRTTNGSGRIASLLFEELRALDNAYWWSPGHDAVWDLPEEAYPLRGLAPGDASLGIAALDDVLAAHPDVFVNLDVKQTAPAVEPYEELLAATLRRHGRHDDVIVASFLDDAIAAFRRAAPEIHTSFALHETLAAVDAMRRGHRVDATASQVAFQIPYRLEGRVVIDEALVSAAHDRGFAVHAWTIDDPDDVRALLELGVDAIISDCPSVVTGIVASAGGAPAR